MTATEAAAHAIRAMSADESYEFLTATPERKAAIVMAALAREAAFCVRFAEDRAFRADACEFMAKDYWNRARAQ